MNRARRFAPVAMLMGFAIMIVSVSNAQAGGPWGSIVSEPVLFVCPAGDATFHVLAQDLVGIPSQNSTIEVLWSDCPAVHAAPTRTGDPYSLWYDGTAAVMVTGSDGWAVFPLRAGGACTGNQVRLRADGYPFATRNMVSPDQNGDLVVDTRDLALLLGRIHAAYDPAADLDADGAVNVRDLALLMRHMGHHS